MWLLIFLFVAFASSKKTYWSVANVTDPQHFAATHGLRYVTSVHNYSVFEGTRKRDAIPIAGMHQEVERRQFKRYYSRFSDPLFPQQWHLRTIGLSSTVTGRGVNVAIVDDGVQFAHPDLAANFDASLSYDFNHNQASVNPYRDDGHGTSAAGTCCAVRNNVCGRGVAYNAKIVGIRLISEPAYDYQEAQALIHHRDKIPIYSCSWGPADTGDHLSGPGRITYNSLWSNNIYVWASGNGHQNQDNSNYDGYANHPNVIAIGALDHTGHPAYYSEGGACLFAMAPSSGAGEGISTTDLMGYAGYAAGECTNDFGGTSAAAPVAAGIFALMKEVRPELTSRDIQHIIARGKRHTHDRGFGLLQVLPLLESAKTHKLVGPQLVTRITGISLGNAQIPSGRWFSRVIPVPAGIVFIERIAITVTMTHARRGQVLLLFGDSILSELRNDRHNGRSTWTYTTVHEWGKHPASFTFQARDAIQDGYSGSLESLEVVFYHTLPVE